MKLSKFCSIAAAAVASLVIVAPNAESHNSAKYTNVPFVVAGSCPSSDSAVSARIVTINRVATLQVVTDAQGSGGCEVYCSAPGTGTLPSGAAGTFPEGILTFNFSTSSPGVAIGAAAFYADEPTTPIFITPITSANRVSFSVTNPTTPGARVISVLVYAITASGTAAVSMNNFSYNSSALLFDTTVTDQSSDGINFCDPL